MRVLFLERATRSGHTGYVAILDTVAIAPSDGLTRSYSESDAYIWSKGVAADLGTVDGDCFSEGFAINSSSQVVGQSFPCDFSFLRTFLWENGSIIDLNALGSPAVLRLIEALVISNRGVIGGIGVPPGCSDFTDDACGHAFLLIPVCPDGSDGCADAPLDPTVVAQSRAESAAASKTMTAEELAIFKERIARISGQNRGFRLRLRR